MILKPSDLCPEAASAFRVWTKVFGLSESAALAAVQQDGLVQLPEHDQLARTFREVFDLSEGAARFAADGRGGTSVRPVSEVAGRPAAGPKPGDNGRLIRIIEAWAQDLLAHGQLCVERGETRELAALREVYGKVLSHAQNDLQLMWMRRVAEARWPELSTRPGLSGSGNKGSSSGRISGTVAG